MSEAITKPGYWFVRLENGVESIIKYNSTGSVPKADSATFLAAPSATATELYGSQGSIVTGNIGAFSKSQATTAVHNGSAVTYSPKGLDKWLEPLLGHDPGTAVEDLGFGVLGAAAGGIDDPDIPDAASAKPLESDPSTDTPQADAQDTEEAENYGRKSTKDKVTDASRAGSGVAGANLGTPSISGLAGLISLLTSASLWKGIGLILAGVLVLLFAGKEFLAITGA